MKSRALLAVPVACALAYLLARALAPGDPPLFHLTVVLLAKALALAGCVAAATRFDRGDRMRTIWNLFVLDFALLLVKDLVANPLLVVGPRFLGDALAGHIRTVCLLGANLAGTAAWIVLARTWRIAGLTLAGSPARQRAALIAAIAAAVALVGWGTAHDVRALLAGQPDSLLDVISDVADVIGFALVAPVALTAYTLRGGSLSWPYLYLAACSFCWMVYDMTDALGTPLGISAAKLSLATQAARCMACGFHFVAGVAARWSVRGAGSQTPAVTPPARAAG